MKKILITLFTGSAMALHAQPTLTAVNDASPGDSFTYIFADSTGITPGNGGANQTWDYSGVTPLGLTQTETWDLPAGTPFAATFPGSDITQIVNNGSGVLVYLYHTQTIADTKLEGIVTDNFGAVSEMIYSDTQILRQYPATYNSTLSDSYSGQAVMMIGPAIITIFRYGTYEFIADGYGTLLTPAGTFPNSLRAKIRQVFTDSVVYTGIPIPPLVTHSFSTSFFWASADPGDKLYQFYIGYDTTMTDADTVHTVSVSHQDITTGIEDQVSENHQEAIAFPVPATEVVKISIPGSETGVARLSVYDTRGVLIKELETFIKEAGNFEWYFPVTDLSKGIYFAKISCNNKSWNVKLLR